MSSALDLAKQYYEANPPTAPSSATTPERAATGADVYEQYRQKSSLPSEDKEEEGWGSWLGRKGKEGMEVYRDARAMQMRALNSMTFGATGMAEQALDGAMGDYSPMNIFNQPKEERDERLSDFQKTVGDVGGGLASIATGAGLAGQAAKAAPKAVGWLGSRGAAPWAARNAAAPAIGAAAALGTELGNDELEDPAATAATGAIFGTAGKALGDAVSWGANRIIGRGGDVLNSPAAREEGARQAYKGYFDDSYSKGRSYTEAESGLPEGSLTRESMLGALDSADPKRPYAEAFTSPTGAKPLAHTLMSGMSKPDTGELTQNVVTVLKHANAPVARRNAINDLVTKFQPATRESGFDANAAFNMTANKLSASYENLFRKWNTPKSYASTKPIRTQISKILDNPKEAGKGTDVAGLKTKLLKELDFIESKYESTGKVPVKVLHDFKENLQRIANKELGKSTAQSRGYGKLVGQIRTRINDHIISSTTKLDGGSTYAQLNKAYGDAAINKEATEAGSSLFAKKVPVEEFADELASQPNPAAKAHFIRGALNNLYDQSRKTSATLENFVKDPEIAAKLKLMQMDPDELASSVATLRDTEKLNAGYTRSLLTRSGKIVESGTDDSAPATIIDAISTLSPTLGQQRRGPAAKGLVRRIMSSPTVGEDFILNMLSSAPDDPNTKMMIEELWNAKKKAAGRLPLLRGTEAVGGALSTTDPIQALTGGRH